MQEKKVASGCAFAKSAVIDFKPIVFYSSVDCENADNGALTVYPKLREEEINSCKSNKAKLQKYAVWKLLEYAVNSVIRLDFDKITFKKEKNGKWVCGEFYFSLSHSENLVAVALSPYPIGIDVEKVKLFNLDIADKILTSEEKNEYVSLKNEQKQEHLLKIWCKKECLLKASGENALLPSKRQTVGREFFESEVVLLGERYYVCTFGENVDCQTLIIESKI